MRLCRRVLLAGLAALLLVSSLYAQTLTVKVRRGNVRSGPGTTYDIVGTVKRGEKYKANASQGDWFKVLLETGQKGWVYKSLVDVSRKRSIGTVAGSPTESVSPHYGNSWAVVIGIDRYSGRTRPTICRKRCQIGFGGAPHPVLLGRAQQARRPGMESDD